MILEEGQDLEDLVEEKSEDLESREDIGDTELEVRKRLAKVETRDAIEKVEVPELEDAREEAMEKLDETFRELSAYRKSLHEGNDVEPDDLGGSSVPANILDGFQEAGYAVQEKYEILKKEVEHKFDPSAVATMPLKSYMNPPLSQEMRVLDYFTERAKRQSFDPQEIDSEEVKEAIKTVYSREEYENETERAFEKPIIRNTQRDVISEIQEAESLEDSGDLVDRYTKKIDEFTDYLSKKMREKYPVDQAEEIWG